MWSVNLPISGCYFSPEFIARPSVAFLSKQEYIPQHCCDAPATGSDDKPAGGKDDTMPDNGEHKLKVSLSLKWDHGDVYKATVTVTVTDSCYVPGELRHGLPSGTVGVPEVEYLTFDFTHGGICSDIVKHIAKTIDVTLSPPNPKVTAFAAVNGNAAGADTTAFPQPKQAHPC